MMIAQKLPEDEFKRITNVYINTHNPSKAINYYIFKATWIKDKLLKPGQKIIRDIIESLTIGKNICVVTNSINKSTNLFSIIRARLPDVKVMVLIAKRLNP